MIGKRNLVLAIHSYAVTVKSSKSFITSMTEKEKIQSRGVIWCKRESGNMIVMDTEEIKREYGCYVF